MSYYTRILSASLDVPSAQAIQQQLDAAGIDASVTVDDEEGGQWTALLLSGPEEMPIAAIERNVVLPGSLGEEELEEFAEFLEDAEPASGAAWVREYLGRVRVIHAFQHLHGSASDEGFAALDAVRQAIAAAAGGIFQADGEGFSNEEGHHVVWLFDDDEVSGPWSMAVLVDGGWKVFGMDLGDREQRQHFLAGRVPPGVAR